ncbi:MAG: SDR family oxidoreductase [Chitinophagaceae bacterium]|nr:SDR family oxidoreductase [Chitinophagaceae bacterium]
MHQQKIIVFGATGMVGRQLVQQALFNGHTVRAFGRNVYTTDFPDDPNLQRIQGALFDATEVLNAIRGCDAVLTAIGGGTDSNDKTRTLGIKNIIAQMKKAGVNRIIGIGGMGVLNADDKSLLIDQDDYPEEYKAVGLEHRKAWEMLKESGLEWTFVCPPNIINEGPTGSFITAEDYVPLPNKYQVNAGDLALFMLNELNKNEFLKHRVGISN